MKRQVVVTDHALVRWLERARGIDMEHLRGALAELAQPYSDMHVKHANIDGLWFVFDGAVLVTVNPSKPSLVSNVKNDKGGKNGTHLHSGPMPWQAKKRRRDHR